MSSPGPGWHCSLGWGAWCTFCFPMHSTVKHIRGTLPVVWSAWPPHHLQSTSWMCSRNQVCCGHQMWHFLLPQPHSRCPPRVPDSVSGGGEGATHTPQAKSGIGHFAQSLLGHMSGLWVELPYSVPFKRRMWRCADFHHPRKGDTQIHMRRHLGGLLGMSFINNLFWEDF